MFCATHEREREKEKGENRREKKLREEGSQEIIIKNYVE